MLKEVENKKCYLLCHFSLKKLNKLNKSTSKEDEESEGSSNESWLKKRAIDNKAFVEQIVLLRLDMLELKLYARLDEL